MSETKKRRRKLTESEREFLRAFRTSFRAGRKMVVTIHFDPKRATADVHAEEEPRKTEAQPQEAHTAEVHTPEPEVEHNQVAIEHKRRNEEKKKLYPELAHLF